MPLPPELLRTVSKEEVNALPIHRYEGPVHVVEALEALEHAMHDIRAETVLGFDTETRPAFKPGESYLPALAQIATSRAVYLVPLQRFDASGPMAELLGAGRIAKAGVGMEDDLRS